MSKASKFIVLCEDEAHKIFATRFLARTWRIDSRNITVVPYPGGQGSGKKHVFDTLGRHMKAYRSRQASTVLIVMADADEEEVASMQKALDEKVEGGRKKDEQIIYVIPKWHIETWLAWLDGDENVDETDKHRYKNRYSLEKRNDRKTVHHLVDTLAKHCRDNEKLVSPPDSLIAACNEFGRIRDTLS